MNDTTPFRPMRRFKQELAREDCDQILYSAYRGFLSVIGDGGYPYTLPINFVYADGKLYFNCAREVHKLDALRAWDKACFTVIDDPVREPDDWWYHVNSVICFGRVRIIEDAAEALVHLKTLGAKYCPEGYDIEGDLAKNGPRAVVLEMALEHVTGKKVREK